MLIYLQSKYQPEEPSGSSQQEQPVKLSEIRASSSQDLATRITILGRDRFRLDTLVFEAKSPEDYQSWLSELKRNVWIYNFVTIATFLGSAYVAGRTYFYYVTLAKTPLWMRVAAAAVLVVASLLSYRESGRADRKLHRVTESYGLTIQELARHRDTALADEPGFAKGQLCRACLGGPERVALFTEKMTAWVGQLKQAWPYIENPGDSSSKETSIRGAEAVLFRSPTAVPLERDVVQFFQGSQGEQQLDKDIREFEGLRIQALNICPRSDRDTVMIDLIERAISIFQRNFFMFFSPPSQ